MHDEWHLRHIATLVRLACAGAAGEALRELARELTDSGVDDAVVDRVYAKAAQADGVHVVREGRTWS